MSFESWKHKTSKNEEENERSEEDGIVEKKKSPSKKHTPSSEANEQTAEFIYKTLVIGDDGVGKKSLIKNTFSAKNQLKTGRNYYTIGFDFKTLKHSIKNYKTRFQFWITNPNPQFKPTLKTGLNGAKISLMLIDYSRPETFEKVKKYIPPLEKEGVKKYSLLIANKTDLPKKINSKKIINYAEKEGLLGYIQISNKTGKNTQHILPYLALARREPKTPKISKNLKKITSKITGEKYFRVV